MLWSTFDLVCQGLFRERTWCLARLVALFLAPPLTNMSRLISWGTACPVMRFRRTLAPGMNERSCAAISPKHPSMWSAHAACLQVVTPDIRGCTFVVTGGHPSPTGIRRVAPHVDALLHEAWLGPPAALAAAGLSTGHQAGTLAAEVGALSLLLSARGALSCGVPRSCTREESDDLRRQAGAAAGEGVLVAAPRDLQLAVLGGVEDAKGGVRSAESSGKVGRGSQLSSMPCA